MQNTKLDTSTTREEALDSLEKKLSTWNEDLDRLEGRVHRLQAGARQRFERALESLRARGRAYSASLEQVRQGGEEAWMSLSAGLEESWDAMTKALHQARHEVAEADTQADRQN